MLDYYAARRKCIYECIMFRVNISISSKNYYKIYFRRTVLDPNRSKIVQAVAPAHLEQGQFLLEYTLNKSVYEEPGTIANTNRFQNRRAEFGSDVKLKRSRTR
jgi:hypothetical protein